MKGKVYLVGAGPGDPELLTLRAWRVLSEADVVLHDDLVSEEILAAASPAARIENVGKRCGRKGIRQEEIHDRMAVYARRGLCVARLKGGDPLIFGRAGEEMEALRRARIEFEVVPGVTAACGAAAAANIPLTDRRMASKIVFLSNHACKEKTAPDWKDVVSHDATVVVYMPGADYNVLRARLNKAGVAAHTPCVAVSCATGKRQQSIATTVQRLGEAPQLPRPVLLIIGAVAADYCRKAKEARFAENLLEMELAIQASLGAAAKDSLGEQQALRRSPAATISNARLGAGRRNIRARRNRRPAMDATRRFRRGLSSTRAPSPR
jgi:uroporphyrin-III C-methyltransferase